MDFEEKLREHLTARASRVDVSPPQTANPIRLDRPLRRRPWLAIGTAAAAVVAVVGISLTTGSEGTGSTPVGVGEGENDEGWAESEPAATTEFVIGEPLEFTAVSGALDVPGLWLVESHDGGTYGGHVVARRRFAS